MDYSHRDHRSEHESISDSDQSEESAIDGSLACSGTSRANYGNAARLGELELNTPNAADEDPLASMGGAEWLFPAGEDASKSDKNSIPIVMNDRNSQKTTKRKEFSKGYRQLGERAQKRRRNYLDRKTGFKNRYKKGEEPRRFKLKLTSESGIPLVDGGGVEIGRVDGGRSVQVNRGQSKKIDGTLHIYIHAVKATLSANHESRYAGEKSTASGFIDSSYFEEEDRLEGLENANQKKGAGRHRYNIKFRAGKTYTFRDAPQMPHLENDSSKPSEPVLNSDGTNPIDQNLYYYKVIRKSKAKNEMVGDYVCRPDGTVPLLLKTPNHGGHSTDRFQRTNPNYVFERDENVAPAYDPYYGKDKHGKYTIEKGRMKFLYGRVYDNSATDARGRPKTLGWGFMAKLALSDANQKPAHKVANGEENT